MKKNKAKAKVSPETISESMKMAKATQREGQTKEQTKLIALGIQKGIDLYKKQQKSKARELDKKLRKVRDTQHANSDDEEDVQSSSDENTSSKLPWVLLALSWIGFIVYQVYLV